MNQHTPPIIIAFASGKGGVGKSTSCLSIGGALAARGDLVHIVDFDQNETLHRWYVTNDPANRRGNLTVEKPSPDVDLGSFIKSLYMNRTGYVLIDLAGSLTNVMVSIAAIANLVIIPSKINEPDFMEAQKLARQINLITQRIGKSIMHRMLINELPQMISALQRQALEKLKGGAVPRFDTMIASRAAYPETFLTGLPPHFSDQNRGAIANAVKEVNMLIAEIDALTLAASPSVQEDGTTAADANETLKEAA